MRGGLTALSAAAVLAAAGLFYGVRSPAVALLPPVDGAEWLAGPAPVNLQIWADRDYVQEYRVRFSVAEVPAKAVLTAYFMKDAVLRLDGRVILAPRRDLEPWKTPRAVDLSLGLKPGEHELSAAVVNHGGPPLMAASCPALGIATGKGWPGVRLAAEFRRAPVALEFPSAADAFAELLPLYLLVFLAVWARAPRLDPARVRWALLAAAGALAVNNIFKFPAGIGMDVSQHLDYIRYVARKGRLPLATEGWQMFQPPLYYALSAPFYLAFSVLGDADFREQALRIVPLACWLGQIELTFRFLRLAQPGRADLQALGTLIGGLLPMNIYLAQAPGNEPLAALLSAWALYLAAKNGAGARSGAVFGLALLAKLSAFLLAVPLVWLTAKRSGRRGLLVFLASAFAVCGWFYIRNYVLLGRPFFGGSWDSMGGTWWQDPGYRSLRDFFVFGESLRRPVYSSLNGFWDAVYSSLWLDGNLSGITTFRSRPPWNFGLMVSGAWLALIPCGAMIMGLLRAMRERAPRPLRLSLVCAAVYLAAMLALYLKLPIYSTGKATYMAGLTPCLACLAAAGLERVPMRLATAGLASWAVSAYAAYWVL